MNKRLLAVCAGVAMLGSAFYPGSATAAPNVPAEPNIVDPLNDANYLNDQGNAGAGGVVPSDGDHVTPADASTVADIVAAWFTHDKDTISAHIQTQAPGGNAVPGYIYQIYASPGQGPVGSSALGCLRFLSVIPGSAQGVAPTTWHGGAMIKLIDRCNEGSNTFNNGIEGEHVIEDGPDGTGILTMTFPRSYSPLLADGQTITAPSADTRNASGERSTVILQSPVVDNTKVGTDYVIAGGPAAGPPPSNPGDDAPGKDDPPGKGKKKGCKKGKGKKKGACKGGKDEPSPPPAPGCSAYVPGAQGADAETVVVTDGATEETPLELTITHGVGAFVASGSNVFANIQVDTAAADAGLYVRYEFPAYEDHDLYVNHADGSRAAAVGGFNPAPFVPGETDGTGTGGHSEQGAEQLDGLRTADCAGYTADFDNFLGEGGEYTVKLWLGDVQNEPTPPGSRMVMDVMSLF